MLHFGTAWDQAGTVIRATTSPATPAVASSDQG
jgi:hypothetical protein